MKGKNNNPGSLENKFSWVREMRVAHMGPQTTFRNEPRLFETNDRPHMTRKKIEERCKKAVDEGCSAIRPMLAHFRWDFMTYFDEIERFFCDLTEIGHKYGLKVWEHHSVVLMRNIKGVKYKKWSMEKLTVMDFRNGQGYRDEAFSRERTANYVLCSTNPFFRDAYFDLIKRFVINSGVDIFVPDDMGWAHSFYTCACPYCRKLFKELTGYSMPKAGDLDMNFFMNMENPSWRAWVRFRSRRVAHFLKALRRFLDDNGRRDLVMTTCNSDSLSNLSRMFGNDHETEIQEGGLNLLEHEVCESQIYSWPRGVVESQTNIGIAAHYSVPLYAHPYPVSNEDAVFGSLLKLSHGQCFTMASTDDAYVNNKNYGVNHFAGKHLELFHARPASNIAVVFSRNSRDFYGKDIFTRTYLELHCDELAGWCESAIRMNYPFRVIPESQVEEDKLEGIEVLILPNCACMSSKEAVVIKNFVRRGGIVIATNETSLYDETGTKRQDFLLKDIFGLQYLTTHQGHSYSIIKNTATEDTVIHYTFSNFPKERYDPALRDAVFAGIPTMRIAHHAPQAVVRVKGKQTQVLAHTPIMHAFDFGHAALTMNPYGKGRVMYFSGLPGLMCHLITNYSESQYGEDPYEYIPPLEPVYGQFMQNIISWALKEKRLFTFDKNVPGMYVNLNRLPDGRKMFLHLNATPKLQFEKDGIHYKGLKQLWHDVDLTYGRTSRKNPHKYPQYWKPGLDYIQVPELEIKIGNRVKFKTARIAGIEFTGWKNLRIGKQSGIKRIRIPGGTVGRYAFIELS